MNATTLVFAICVEVVMYLLLSNLHGYTFRYMMQKLLNVDK